MSSGGIFIWSIDIDTTALQQELLSLGRNPGPIDGKFGARTRKALVTFQANEHDEILGVNRFDPEICRQRLKRYLEAALTLPPICPRS